MSNRVTAASEWKSKSKPEEVEVPSGNIALCRRASTDIFLRKGVMPNSLMPIVEEALKKGETGDIKPEDVIKDIKADDLEDLMLMYDHVIYHIVIQPKLSLPPEKNEEGEEVSPRDPEKLYTDDVDFEDKVFLFNWAVGGTADVESFREGQEENVEPVHSGEDVVDSP